MRRRDFISLFGGAFSWPLAASAQEPGRIYRLGSLQFSLRSAPWHAAFFDASQRQGYIEGQNLVGDPNGYGLRIDQHIAALADTNNVSPRQLQELEGAAHARISVPVSAGERAEVMVHMVPLGR
jgi:hypothetical protein